MKTTITNHRIENTITKSEQRERQMKRRQHDRLIRRSERRDIDAELDTTNLPDVWAQEEVA